MCVRFKFCVIVNLFCVREFKRYSDWVCCGGVVFYGNFVEVRNIFYGVICVLFVVCIYGDFFCGYFLDWFGNFVV